MTAIEFENISKQYRLGLVSTETLSHDLNRLWTPTVSAPRLGNKKEQVLSCCTRLRATGRPRCCAARTSTSRWNRATSWASSAGTAVS